MFYVPKSLDGYKRRRRWRKKNISFKFSVDMTRFSSLSRISHRLLVPFALKIDFIPLLLLCSPLLSPPFAQLSFVAIISRPVLLSPTNAMIIPEQFKFVSSRDNEDSNENGRQTTSQ